MWQTLIVCIDEYVCFSSFVGLRYFFFFWAVLMVQYVDSIVRTNDAMNDTIENHGRIF